MKSTYILFMLSAFTLVSGCKREGCTDKEALNFDLTADKNDGSCIYCPESAGNSVLLEYGILKENRSSSNHFGEDLFDINIEQLGVNNSEILNCNEECVLQITFENLTDFTLENFWVRILAFHDFETIDRIIFLDSIDPYSSNQQSIPVNGSGNQNSCLSIIEYEYLNFSIESGSYQ